MEETISGEGHLFTIELPETERLVQFDFQITTRKTPGDLSTNPTSTSKGTVTALNKEPIPTGTYRLEAEDGLSLKVKNLGFTWTILS